MPKQPPKKPPAKPRPIHKRPTKAPTLSGFTPGDPIFAQPKPSPDPTGFKNPVTDQQLTELNTLEPVPEPTGNAVEPVLTLQDVYGTAGPATAR